MKKIQAFFVVAVLLALLFPIARFNADGTVSAAENRALAQKPQVSLSHFSPSEFNDYFQDRFGGRERLIGIANFVDYEIFKKQIRNSSAFKGKNGWFYYIDSNDGNNLSDFQKTNLLGEEGLNAFKKSAESLVEWCRENNLKYLFVIGPNKHSVYGENYVFARPEGITRADQIVSVFEELGANYVFPRDHLIEQKPREKYPLYYETDTHWNNLGAYHAFEKIRERVERLFPETDFPKIEYEFSASQSETAGDILPMLGIKNAKSTQISASPKGAAFSDYFEYLKNEGTNGVITKGKNNALPKAVVFRDSFYSALTPYFSTLFSSVEYNWRRVTAEDKAKILEDKPDLVVFEAVERYALDIAGN